MHCLKCILFQEGITEASHSSSYSHQQPAFRKTHLLGPGVRIGATRAPGFDEASSDGVETTALARRLLTQILSNFVQNLVELLEVCLQAGCQKHSNRKPFDFRHLEERAAGVLLNREG